MLEENVKVKYYARFHTYSYHCCTEMHFSSRLEVNFDKVIGARNEGQRQQVKSIWRTITMQGFILTATTTAEKCTLFLDSA